MSGAEDFDAMLAASSLGSEQARAIRGQAPAAAREHAGRVLNGEEATMSDHGKDKWQQHDDDPPMDPTLLLAYQAAFSAVADGWNSAAAEVLRKLAPENLAELHVICGDVRTMVEAEQRGRRRRARG